MEEKVVDTKNKDVTPELVGMSVEEALKFLDLTSEANDYEIDESFWKLSKNARVIKNDQEREQRIIDLSYAYDVATGKEAKRLAALEQREAAKKYFGKTSDEWKTYFGYTWYRYLIVIAILVAIGAVCYRIFFTPDEDMAILSIGHFEVEVEAMQERLKDEGFVNPYVTYSNLVVPNDEGEVNGAYSDMTSSILFASEPDIVITDEKTVKYFFVQFDNLDTFYDSLIYRVDPSVIEKIEPVFCSEYDSELLSIEYLESQNLQADRSELETASKEQILIGFKITDPNLIARLGYYNKWPQTEPTLVIGIGKECKDRSKTEEFIVSILKDVR